MGWIASVIASLGAWGLFCYAMVHFVLKWW